MTDMSATAERLALVLTQAGMQRMAARVMCALLFCEEETTTAPELCEQLGASAGAVSGALKTLVSLRLAERMPAPAGDRRDHYRLRPDGWAVMTSSRDHLLDTMLRTADEGIEEVGEDSPAGLRLREMRDFYAYMLREMPALIDRWHEQRRVR
ncbi:GbsR/MarR family transcriptional regulator [Streptacidiphilus sp. ASG 303]|uniref:GbsR/MarR family transcriptional regulator n=1 Tax=Streptomycetaceae TaxID=2062 RepID=UPI001E36C755|nr:winged helix DNA-binding protein [Streptacidiphilus sp. ASG 303]MCD0482439.1 MarR family transcriptional regulator [Streptacidiphilus sp. ASG 303]